MTKNNQSAQTNYLVNKLLGFAQEAKSKFDQEGVWCPEETEKNYWDLVSRLFFCLDHSMIDEQTIYPILQAHLDKLDQNFITTWRDMCRDRISHNILHCLSLIDFAALIYRFPQGNIANNIEIAIASLECIAQFINREELINAWIIVYSNLGTMYNQRIYKDKADNIEIAINYLKKALSVIKVSNRKIEQWFTIWDSLGTSYTNRIKGEREENLKLAISSYQQALQPLNPQNHPEYWAITHHNLGYLLAHNPDVRVVKEGSNTISIELIELSFEHYESALKIWKKDQYPEKWAMCQLNLANAYLSRMRGDEYKNWKNAIEHFNLASKIYTYESFPRLWANIQLNIGDAYYKRYTENKDDIEFHNWVAKGNLEESQKMNDLLFANYDSPIDSDLVHNWQLSIQHYENSLTVFTPQEFPFECYLASQKIAKTLLQGEKWEDSIQNYERAIECVEILRNWGKSDERRQQILAEAIDIYENMVIACINAGKLEKALETVERSRSKKLVDLMSTKDLYQDGNIPSEVQTLLQQYNELQQQIDNERNHHSNDNKDSNRGDRIYLKEYTDTLQQLINEQQKIWNQLREIDFVLAGEIQVTPPELKTIQTFIDNPNIAILSFYSTHSDTYIFIVKKNKITLHTCIGQGKVNLHNWIYQNWFILYKNEYQAWKNNFIPFLSQLSQRLDFNTLIETHLQEIEELIIIPHLTLHFIPFAALPLSDDQYLCDKFRLRHAFSTQILEFCHRRNKITDNLQYGIVENATDDLLCANFEGENIANLYQIPLDNRLIGSQQATVENVRQLMQKVNILHCCHHAEYNLISPLNSSLKLGNGTITLGQLLSPSWRFPDLSDVFLSCCETGLGNPEITDDILTLSAGFLCAGARNVISTLWSVDDLATTLLTLFYYQYRQVGNTRSDALQKAQLKLRNINKEEVKKILKPTDQIITMKREEAKNQKSNYLSDSSEYKYWDNKYRKYTAFKKQMAVLRPYPFSHPQYWSAFTCQGLE